MRSKVAHLEDLATAELELLSIGRSSGSTS
jgi:hypothetical protein